MAGKIYERKKMQGLIAVTYQMYLDLKDAGFTQLLPTTGQTLPQPLANTNSLNFMFESSAAMNPLQSTQPWRILVQASTTAGNNGGGLIRVAIANPQQLDPNDTSNSQTKYTTSFPGSITDTTGTRIMGQLGTQWTPTATTIPPGAAFVTRTVSNQMWDMGTVYSYTMVVTDHGISFCVWENADEKAPAFSWFVVQFPVDKETGAPLVTDQSPLFCIYSADNTEIKKFIINESDVFRVTQDVSAVKDTLNSAAIINAEEQVAIAKGNRYLVTFPNRINTERYAYTEELDMFAYTSADVIAEESEIPVTVYGEATPRIYRAMKSNGPNNTKMRIMFLVQGGGGPEGPAVVP